MTFSETLESIFFSLRPTTLAAIANDLSSPEAWPAAVQVARQLAIAQGEANIGADEFAALMAEVAQQQ